METWTYHGPIMRPTDFSWVSRDAWASQVHEKDGRYWFYTAVEHDEAQGSHGKAIGVAVADNPLGPFRDAPFPAWVNDGEMDGSLLGMDYLGQFRMEFANGRLILRE